MSTDFEFRKLPPLPAIQKFRVDEKNLEQK